MAHCFACGKAVSHGGSMQEEPSSLHRYWKANGEEEAGSHPSDLSPSTRLPMLRVPPHRTTVTKPSAHGSLGVISDLSSATVLFIWGENPTLPPDPEKPVEAKGKGGKENDHPSSLSSGMDLISGGF